MKQVENTKSLPKNMFFAKMSTITEFLQVTVVSAEEKEQFSLAKLQKFST